MVGGLADLVASDASASTCRNMRGKLSHDPPDKVLTQALYKWGHMPLWVWLLPTGIPLLAFAYLPALRVAVEGFPALSNLFNGENLNSLKITLLYTLLTVPPLCVAGASGRLSPRRG